MTNQQALVETLRTYLDSERLTLPVFNSISLRVQQELIKKEPDFGKIEKLIRADQSLSSNIINIANSALYRGRIPVNTVKAAIVRLGISEVARIVFTDINKKIFTSRDSQTNAIMKKLWQHSLGCAFAAGMLSQHLDFGVMQHEAFSAGLFHDVGKLLILKVLAEKSKNNPKKVFPKDVLLMAMDLFHTDQGEHLMRQIKMPEVFAIIARDHHLEEYDHGNYLLVLVRMANHICHALGIGLKEEFALPLLQQPEAIQLRLTDTDLEGIETFLQTTPGLFE